MRRCDDGCTEEVCKCGRKTGCVPAKMQSPNTGATNINGFTALSGGYREFDGNFLNIGNYCLWWTATEAGETKVWDRGLNNESINMYRYNSSYKAAGFSVRCLKD